MSSTPPPAAGSARPKLSSKVITTSCGTSAGFFPPGGLRDHGTAVTTVAADPTRVSVERCPPVHAKASPKKQASVSGLHPRRLQRRRGWQFRVPLLEESLLILANCAPRRARLPHSG